jgi:hypothetical protein
MMDEVEEQNFTRWRKASNFHDGLDESIINSLFLFYCAVQIITIDFSLTMDCKNDKHNATSFMSKPCQSISRANKAKICQTVL